MHESALLSKQIKLNTSIAKILSLDLQVGIQIVGESTATMGVSTHASIYKSLSNPTFRQIHTPHHEM